MKKKSQMEMVEKVTWEVGWMVQMEGEENQMGQE